MLHTRIFSGALVACLLGAATDADGYFWDFRYDTTAGASSTYTGDLSDGTLTLDAIAGRSFRVQYKNHVSLGTFGVGGASLNAAMDLVQFNDNTPVGSGAGDTAYFAGAQGGNDLVLLDEFGESMSGNISFFELTDRTNSAVRPGIEGQGIIEDIIFSGPSFQGADTTDVFNTGTVFTFTFVIEEGPGDPVTLEEYLASSGLNGLAIEVETIEMLVRGHVPLPGTAGLAFAGLAPFAWSARRRPRLS